MRVIEMLVESSTSVATPQGNPQEAGMVTVMASRH